MRFGPSNRGAAAARSLVLFLEKGRFTGMLAPQYSLRKLLAAVVLVGLACLLLPNATRGHIWAIAMLAALMGLGVLMTVQALLFGIAQLDLVYLDVLERRKKLRRETPSARTPPRAGE
jgi:hypothetical protein